MAYVLDHFTKVKCSDARPENRCPALSLRRRRIDAGRTVPRVGLDVARWGRWCATVAQGGLWHRAYASAE